MIAQKHKLTEDQISHWEVILKPHKKELISKMLACECADIDAQATKLQELTEKFLIEHKLI
jgi:hypothetical protein